MLPIPLPPLPEQHRIVTRIEELFSRLDAGVEALQKAKAQLQSYRQSVLKAAVEGRLTEEWRKGYTEDLVPLHDFLEERRSKVLDKKRLSSGESLQNLPDTWISAKIGEIADVVRGASPRPAGDPKYFGGEIPWITVGEITKDSKIYLESVSSFLTEEGKERSRYIEPGTFLLTNSGATLGVPKVTKIGGCINDGSVAILNLNETLKVFLYYYLSTQTKSLRQINQGAAQPNLNTGIVKNLQIPLPPFNEQLKIAEKIESYLAVINNEDKILHMTLKCSDRLRQSILKHAFEGRLIPQDPNDEPAFMLLERIKAEKANDATRRGSMINRSNTRQMRLTQ